MQQQAYINTTADIRIPTEIEYRHFDDVNEEKETLVRRLDNDPDGLLKHNGVTIRHTYIEVE